MVTTWERTAHDPDEILQLPYEETLVDAPAVREGVTSGSCSKWGEVGDETLERRLGSLLN